MKKILTFAVVALTSATMAQTTITWTGGGDTTNYTDGANWGGTAPTDDLTTDIAQLTGGTVNLDANRSVNGLDLNAASTLTGSGTRLVLGGSGLTGATDLTLDNSVILRTTAVPGTKYSGNLTIDGATVETTTGTQGFIGTGTINLDNGGSIIGSGNHVNMADTTSIVLGSGGGTFGNAHGRAFYGLDKAVISGSGTLTLDGGGSTHSSSRIQIANGSGLDNTYTGGTLIQNKANVQTSSDRDFGAVTGKVTINDARVVTSTGIAFDAAREFEIASGGGRISLSDKSSTINGALSGSGALTIDGQNRDSNDTTPSGTLVLNGDGSAFTGNVLIDSAAVRYTSAGQLGSGVVTLDNGGEIYGANHIDMSGNSSIILGSGGGTIRHRHARNVNGLDNVVISGSGALTLAGESLTGSIRMKGSNTYTGGTIFGSGGYALVTSNDALGDSAGSITFDGGRLQNNNSNVLLGNRAITINAGGALIRSGWSGRRIESTGVISGVGALTIEDDSSRVELEGANTYSGGTEIQGTVWAKSGSLGTGDVTLNNINGSRGHLQNNSGAATLANNIIIDDTNGGRMQAGWNANLTINGAVSGSGDLAIVGDSGTVVLANAANTYSGAINLQDATSRLSLASLGGGASISGDTAATLTLTGEIALSAVSGFGGTTKLGAGGALTGSGAYTGDLTLGTGSALTLGETLSVAGLVALDGTFGIGNVAGLSSSTADGTYTLIDTTSTDFSTLGLDNFGSANPYNLGGGKSAYFEQGSLQVTVIPEPATLGLVVAMAGGMLFIRRRFMI